MHTKQIAIAFTLSLVVACGPERRDGAGDGGTGQQDAACNTAITGKVFAPNGTLPLYGVTVYVPGQPPPPFTDGVQCGSCETDLPGGALTRAESGPDGSFRLDNVPPGASAQVILTTGKWRRIVSVPVTQCADNPLPDGTFRLPRNKNEGEIPRIAMVTGGFDSLACIFTKMGIDPNEFGDSSTSDKRVVFYNGTGGASPGAAQPSTALWGNLDELRKFDAVINSCEGNEYPENKTSPDMLRQYADLGGRIFGTHYHYLWAKSLIPEWQSTTTWGSGSSSGPDTVDMSHPKGMALAQWLVNVGASTTLGQVDGLTQKTRDAIGVPATTRRWMYGAGSPAAVHYLSFDTPVAASEDNKCGRVVYAGMHISQSTNTVNASFPAGCSAGLEADEKALIFLLFDLGSCTGTIF
jgi:hypothetical protein